MASSSWQGRNPAKKPSMDIIRHGRNLSLNSIPEDGTIVYDVDRSTTIGRPSNLAAFREYTNPAAIQNSVESTLRGSSSGVTMETSPRATVIGQDSMPEESYPKPIRWLQHEKSPVHSRTLESETEYSSATMFSMGVSDVCFPVNPCPLHVVDEPNVQMAQDSIFYASGIMIGLSSSAIGSTATSLGLASAFI